MNSFIIYYTFICVYFDSSTLFSWQSKPASCSVQFPRVTSHLLRKGHDKEGRVYKVFEWVSIR